MISRSDIERSVRVLHELWGRMMPSQDALAVWCDRLEPYTTDVAEFRKRMRKASDLTGREQSMGNVMEIVRYVQPQRLEPYKADEELTPDQRRKTDDAAKVFFAELRERGLMK